MDVSQWRTFHPPTGREGHPPVAVVFAPCTRLGEQALKNRMNRVMSLTREIWSGEYTKEDQHDGASTTAGYYDCSDTIPLLFTTLDRLRTDGRTPPSGGGAGTAAGKPCPTPWPTPRTSTPGTNATQNTASTKQPECRAVTCMVGSVVEGEEDVVGASGAVRYPRALVKYEANSRFRSPEGRRHPS
ncbi:hypothetical protein ACFUTV_00145 [Streptomyces sp. NPDC057298]|uniref:hypothetical protein n=1 Tax=Streptomyces sp. NPDC057298 TaxID=3346091 RepID=UPI003645C6A1